MNFEKDVVKHDWSVADNGDVCLVKAAAEYRCYIFKEWGFKSFGFRLGEWKKIIERLVIIR